MKSENFLEPFSFLNNKRPRVALIGAHPDDETLWAGGTIIQNPHWDCFIACLCRKSDQDRAPKFDKVLKFLKASGKMADLDDGPEQIPLDESQLEKTILELLPHKTYDLIITHNPNGEYTRHLRHEEISKAVITLWTKKKISTKALFCFAYSDNEHSNFPYASMGASPIQLTASIWEQKYYIMTKIYGFNQESWEAKTCPKIEAFWQFKAPEKAKNWLEKNGQL